jgi:hypothetical protein
VTPAVQGSGGAEEHARRAEEALEEALAERNRLWAELQSRTAQDRELEYYRREVERMKRTLSWRITAPLRIARWIVHERRKVVRLVRRALAGRST